MVAAMCEENAFQYRIIRRFYIICLSQPMLSKVLRYTVMSHSDWCLCRRLELSYHMNAGCLRKLPASVYARRQWVSRRSFLSSAAWRTPAVWVQHGRPALLSAERMCCRVFSVSGSE